MESVQAEEDFLCCSRPLFQLDRVYIRRSNFSTEAQRLRSGQCRSLWTNFRTTNSSLCSNRTILDATNHKALDTMNNDPCRILLASVLSDSGRTFKDVWASKATMDNAHWNVLDRSCRSFHSNPDHS